MPTVVDSLVVTLALDPSKYTKGQREALKAFQNTKDEAKKSGDELEKSGKKGETAFDAMRAGALKFLAVVGGVAGITSYTKNTIAAEAATGRLAKNLGTSTESLSAWQGAVKRMGGAAADADTSIQSIVSDYNQFWLTGTSKLVPFLRYLEIALTDAAGALRPIDELLLDIADKFSKMRPDHAQAIGQQMGFTPEFINLLSQGRDKVKQIHDEMKRLNSVTKDQAKASQDLLQSWEDMWSALDNRERQAIQTMKGGLKSYLDDITSFVSNPSVKTFYNFMTRDIRAVGAWWDSQVNNPSGIPPAPGNRASTGKINYGGGGGVPSAMGGSDGQFGYGKFQPSAAEINARERRRIELLEQELRENPGDSALQRELSDVRSRFAKSNVDPALGAGRTASLQSSRSGGNTTTVQINELNVKTMATDAPGIAKDLGAAIQTYSFAAQANTGLD